MQDNGSGPRYPESVLTPRMLKAARALLDMTQAELAAKAGVSLSALRGFETGRVQTYYPIVLKLERAVKAAGIKLLEPDRDGGQGVRLARR